LQHQREQLRGKTMQRGQRIERLVRGNGIQRIGALSGRPGHQGFEQRLLAGVTRI
jgi:hypothetical protein